MMDKPARFDLGGLTVDRKVFDRHFLTKNGLRLLPQVMQLPHHGARIEPPFCCDAHNEFPHNCTLPISPVVSYGIKNTYEHPGLLCVRCNSDSHQHQLMSFEMVNERKGFSYTIVY